MSDEPKPVAILSWEQADQIIQDQRAEIARLRLTDAEREAISSAAYLCEATAGLAHERANATAWATCAATLRGLLERHGGLPDREHPPRKEGATPARSGESGDDSPDRE